MMKVLKQHAGFVAALALAFMLQLSLIALVLACIGLGASESEQAAYASMVGRNGGVLAALAMLLLFGLGAGLSAFFKAYPESLARLSEDVVLLVNNARHRAAPQGAREVRQLAEKINALACAREALHEEVQETIERNGRALAEERNRLAALMAELSLSVLVCNLEGRILLYNEAARRVLGIVQGPSSIGLGRSVFAVMDRGLIEHAIERIEHQLKLTQEDTAHPVAGFVAAMPGGRMLRARMAAVLSNGNMMDGFVLTLEDITENMGADARRDLLLQALTQDSRSAVANIRAALETMQAFPDMSGTKRMQFQSIIDMESQRLAQRIDHVMQEYDDSMEARWQLEEMHAGDLLGLLARRMESAALKACVSDTAESALWLRVDSYALTQALVWFAQRLALEMHVPDVRLGLQRAGRLAYLDMIWTDAPLDAGTLHVWENAELPIGGHGTLPTLKEMLKQHGAESVYRSESSHHVCCYRLLLPLSESAERSMPPLRRPSHPSRPRFYDFDLFQQSGQSAELDDRLLTQLSYTVFDTETTGLQPAEGDEIISIGALRIVNGRLLPEESFDQLVRSRRRLSAESVAIHGITMAMLEGQPGIDIVLPQFYRFAEDTVLVGHNAAFDMRFLQLLEGRTGVRFTQPVLDTLLLSQVIHPHQDQHSLEAIAARLGVPIIDRHTALGDAMVTGEVFLRMLPLLHEKGIHTLKDARLAAQQTLYADIRY